MPKTPRPDDASDEPREEDLGLRSFANQNVAEDQQQQARDRGAGLGAGSLANRNARHGDPATTITDTTGVERDGNGDPLGGMRPEDDID